MAKIRTKVKRRHVVGHTLELSDDERFSLQQLINAVIVEHPGIMAVMPRPQADDVIRVVNALESVKPAIQKAAKGRNKHRAATAEYTKVKE